MRLLIATDIASEGINLHFLSHKLIHFDIPWSLMVFQQRNGRIDRYGQERQPHIAYLYTSPSTPRFAATCAFWNCSSKRTSRRPRISATHRSFLGVFDEREEEHITGRAIEENLAPPISTSTWSKSADDDLLAMLFGDAPVPAGQTVHSRCHTFPSLFADDLEYFRDGLSALTPAVDLQADFDP